jgi:hypothetical protein
LAGARAPARSARATSNRKIRIPTASTNEPMLVTRFSVSQPKPVE